jgi:threonine dehydratase
METTMRKPRNFDAELKALGDKARELKTRKVQQLGELVIATSPKLNPGILVMHSAQDWATKNVRAARDRLGVLRQKALKHCGGLRAPENEWSRHPDGGCIAGKPIEEKIEKLLSDKENSCCYQRHTIFSLRGKIFPIRKLDTMNIPSFADMLIAHERIKPHIHRTAILTSRVINELSGAELFFKCENFQKAGAFKARGASNAVFGLNDAQTAKGVATHSSGNHGTCLSYAAGRRGIPCTVVMPRTAPQAKKDAVRGYGGKVVECEPSTSSREAVFAEVVAETGAEFVHPYNDPRVIAGQATCAKELVEQVDHLDAVIAPIGGGGMVSGTCLTLSNLAPKIKIYAAEPEQADDAYRSFKAGHIIADDAPDTVADGLKVPLKDLTWHFVSKHVTDIFTASEQEIVDAMKLIWKRMKIIMEPSSAVPLATILKNRDVFAGRRVGMIITGGNVDLDKLPWQ